MIKRTAVSLLILALSCIGASASDCWNNVAATQTDCGQVDMYLNGSNQAVPVAPATPMPVAPQTYPSGATPLTNSASAVATLAGAAGKTTYICGFSIDSNATAATSSTASITNSISGTMNFVQAVAALPAVATLSRTFTPCIPATAQNTSISVGAATGGGGGATTVNAWGYQQ